MPSRRRELDSVKSNQYMVQVLHQPFIVFDLHRLWYTCVHNEFPFFVSGAKLGITSKTLWWPVVLAPTIACGLVAPQPGTRALYTHHGQRCLHLVWAQFEGKKNGKYHCRQHDFDPLMMRAILRMDHIVCLVVHCHLSAAICLMPSDI